MTEIVRAQKRALEIIASFARNQAATDFLRLPADGIAAAESIEMMSLPREMFDSILTCAMDNIAHESVGKEKTQKEVAAALIAETPFPDKLVANLMGYAGHWREEQIADRLCRAFRGRRMTRFEDPEMTEFFETEDYVEHARSMASFNRRMERIRQRTRRRA